MKKAIAGLILFMCVFSVIPAQAESMTGFVFSQDNAGKFWRIGKKGGSGENVAIAVIPADEAVKVSPFNGKTVKVTGELDPSSTFPKFKPGFTVEVVE
jgi:hypothetical protein